MNTYHIPVMLRETISLLDIKEGGWYIDCNLGGGGHTSEILKLGGKVLGIDLDPEAINEVAKNYHLEVKTVNNHLLAQSDNLILYQSNFSQVRKITQELGLDQVWGVLFDLGVSSHQLESPQRGFSFNIKAPLDMRMGPDFQVTASDLVNGLHEKELAELFLKYGEENFARPIAKKIVEYRQKKRIEEVDELAGIILKVRPRSNQDRTHPATRVFQALRIAVNDELHSLEVTLPEAFNLLAQDGRIAAISFHSLEDRIVKNFFREMEKKRMAEVITKKPITPSLEEINSNPRSRSGKLRCIRRI